MLRSIFGKKEEDDKSIDMASATSISAAVFKETLGRYPALIKARNEAKSDGDSLVELDQYRYIDAPAKFSKATGRNVGLEDIKKLASWKLKHGKFHPSRPKLFDANSDETIASVTKEAFDFHASNPSDVTGTIKLLSELKGVGPATASLLLAVHDPKHVIFFSDEAYSWLVADGKKTKLTYTTKEYEVLFAESQTLMKRLKVTPIEIEQVAYVLIKENEPVYETKGPYVPSGKPRGRPRMAESEKKVKKASVPGRGRGRPATNGTATSKAAATEDPLAKKRGRPAKAKADTEEDEEVKTPKGSKRAAADSEPPSARKSGKKARV